MREKYEKLDVYSLILAREDYGTFRRWAVENRYGDSGAAFRKLLRQAGLLADDERVEGKEVTTDGAAQG